MSRMNIEGNSLKKARIYGIAIPKKWENTFRNKAKKMEYGWNFLKLRTFLVYENNKVEEKTYKQFVG